MTYKHWVSLFIQFSVQFVICLLFSSCCLFYALSLCYILVIFVTLTLRVSFWVIVMLDFCHFFSMRSLVLFQIRNQDHAHLCLTLITNDWIELISSADLKSTIQFSIMWESCQIHWICFVIHLIVLTI